MPGRFRSFGRRRRRLYPRPFQGSGSPYGRLIDPDVFTGTVPTTGALAVECRTIEDAGGSSSDESVHLYKASIQFYCSMSTSIIPPEADFGVGIMAYPVSLVRRVPTTSPPALQATEVVNSPDAIIGHPFPISLRNGGIGSVVVKRPIHLMNNALGGYESIWEGGLLFTSLNQPLSGVYTLNINMIPRYYQRFQYPGRSSG